ncbi:hypothetical protein sscle_10g075500 [Sclerotinia sclerotiorum 1980 UF-70]|uniref:2EXR domain-containing protein n=2 Tax=Sclerotinia sclerotiorum (strain ATCC 18683 / 1980 / Ss-1) TaxID=665079 RepID=A0A1D9QCV0_SCLS1|nr:hypothetical protein sscle_10g075500 [Sclerotinia sclerotiorum 1980 UF-70]
MKGLKGFKTGNASKKQDQAPKVKHRSPKFINNVLAKAHKRSKFSTFHPFERLPIDLQTIIWEFSIEPRPVLHRERNTRLKRNRKGRLEPVDDTEISYDDPPSDELPFWPRTYSHYVVFDWITLPCCRHTPAILHVSKTAREIGLRHYKAKKSLQLILQEPPQSLHQSEGIVHFDSSSSKAMYISQNHDLWCWESYFYFQMYSPLPSLSNDVHCFIYGFLHQLVTPILYELLKSSERIVPEDSIGDEQPSRKERVTLIIHMPQNSYDESRMDKRGKFRKLVTELRGSEKLVAQHFDDAGIHYRPVDLKCSRFGFCKQCLNATEDVAIGEDMEANLQIWAKPKHLRKKLQNREGYRLGNKCKSSCYLTWGAPYQTPQAVRLLLYGVEFLAIPFIVCLI